MLIGIESKTEESQSLVPPLASFVPLAHFFFFWKLSFGHPPGKAPNHKDENKGVDWKLREQPNDQPVSILAI